MRIAGVLALGMLLAACTAASGTQETVEMQTIASGGQARDDSGRKAVLATTSAEYAQRWSELIGSGEGPPDVDFTTEVAVFLLAGQRSTGGYSVEPQSVQLVEDGTAVVTARIAAPPPGSMVIQVITSPYAIVAIRNRSITKVRWPQ